MVQIEKIAYGGWENCTRISNSQVELIVTTDVGPRIIHYGFNGQHNEFYVDEETLGATGGDEWRVYGGHRLWTAPEDPIFTYRPDNMSLDITFEENGLTATQPVDPVSGIQKSMRITLQNENSKVFIEHVVNNKSDKELFIAPWAITMMAAGGTAILPLPKRGSHPQNLLATSSLALWPYTDMSDERWLWGHEYILLRQDVNVASPQKVGLNCPDGWAAYANKQHVFIKLFTHDTEALYPDMNCNVEVFTNQDMLELESLAPFFSFPPGVSAMHMENWFLFDGIQPIAGEEQVRDMILPLVNSLF